MTKIMYGEHVTPHCRDALRLLRKIAAGDFGEAGTEGRNAAIKAAMKLMDDGKAERLKRIKSTFKFSPAKYAEFIKIRVLVPHVPIDDEIENVLVVAVFGDLKAKFVEMHEQKRLQTEAA